MRVEGLFKQTSTNLYSVIKTWHVFVAYQIANIFCFMFNCYGKTLPTIAKVTLWTSLISFAVILITVPAVAPTHQHARFVFATFINSTGWEQGGIAFIVGLVNTNWSFACLDCATHLAEEVHRPERMIPIAIMGTVGIGFVTSWFWSMSMFFSIVGDFTEIISSATLVPILELFYKASGNKAGAIVLESLIIATGLGCLVASHTWQSRLCWSFARDRGLPGHRWLSKVHPKLDVPINAHFTSCVIVAIVGCLYLASLTAFNSQVNPSPTKHILPLTPLQHDHSLHRPPLPQLLHPRNLSPHPGSIDHQARSLLARSHRPLRQHCYPLLDALHAHHVQLSVRQTGAVEQHELCVACVCGGCHYYYDGLVREGEEEF